MILSLEKDPRLTLVRRGGLLSDEDHHLLALGAAAYALRAANDPRAEAAWQMARLPEAIRTLVLEDQARRNPLCWNVFPVG